MALIFNGSHWFGGEYPDTTQEGRSGIVCAHPSVPRRRLWLRDCEPADAGGRNGRRHDLSPDAADAGGRAGQHLSDGSAGRAAAKILPHDRSGALHAESPAWGMETLYRLGGKYAGRRAMSRALFLARLRQGLKGLSPDEIDDI